MTAFKLIAAAAALAMTTGEVPVVAKVTVDQAWSPERITAKGASQAKLKLAVLSPAAVCGPVSEPGSITQSYAVTAAPEVPMDSLDDDSASPDGSCASTGETGQQPSLDGLFTSPYIA